MKEIWDLISKIVVMLIIATIIGVLLGVKDHKINELKKTAISLGYAEYNLTNGLWQWKTNTVDKR